MAPCSYNIDRGSIYGSASGGFQNNDYELPDPQTGQYRSDDILTLGLGMGYRLTHYFSLWGSYVYEDRDSLYQYSYTTNIFTLGLVSGLLIFESSRNRVRGPAVCGTVRS